MSKRAINLISPVSFRELVSSKANNARIVPIDGSWYMPNNPRNAKSEFSANALPGAKFFDVEEIKDAASPYPHMLPSLEDFNKGVSKLGLQKDDTLVVYDRVGNFSAPRVAWTFQTFGHDNVFLLNNLPLYEKYKYPFGKGELGTQGSNYESNELDSNAVLSYEKFIDIVSHEDKRKNYTILDARSYDRYTGEAPEPRPGLSSGHAPGAISLPFGKVLGADNLFLIPALLKFVVKRAGVVPDKPIIVMCGTGVTACILKAALDSIGYNKCGIQVFDGSWTEYAQRAPKELIVKEED